VIGATSEGGRAADHVSGGHHLCVTIAAVLFDMDGTLVDSEKVWDVALDELAAEYGGELSATARLAMVGTGMAQSLDILHTDLEQPWRDPAVGARWLERRVATLFASGLEWRAGARALLCEVRAAGLPTALVTSTARRLVDVALDTLGRDRFDAVVCGDEVERPKPDPAPYRAAAATLGVPIERCVAIEDSPSGVASARAAGAVVLAVPCAVALSDVDGVHLRDSLRGVDLAVLTELARRGGETVGWPGDAGTAA
jgi:HAD superfamily hydrolase (TIGR01509 family)